MRRKVLTIGLICSSIFLHRVSEAMNMISDGMRSEMQSCEKKSIACFTGEMSRDL